MATRELRRHIEDLEDATWQALQRSGSALVPYLTADRIMQFPLVGLIDLADTQSMISIVDTHLGNEARS